MQNDVWFLLQLFGGEGAGGSGGSAGGEGGGTDSGENAAAAGQQRLRELGVPENRIRKNRVYQMTPKTEQKATAEASGNQKEQAAAADDDPPAEEEKKAETSPRRMTWDEIMADPEYNKAMQNTMQQRLRSVKGQEEAMQKLTPALEMLMKKHGMDPAKPDYEALAAKIMDDDSLYEDKAMELDVDTSIAKKLTQQDMELNRYRRQETVNLEQQKVQQHFQGLEQQAEALRKQFPGFDLRKELQNPAFARMCSPNSGISVEDAYYAVHRKDIQNAQAQVIASGVASQMSNAIKANSMRPNESGAGKAPSVTHFDYRKASKAERNDLKKRIRSAAARGEKIYPGQ